MIAPPLYALLATLALGMRPHGGHPSPGNRHGDICHEFIQSYHCAA